MRDANGNAAPTLGAWAHVPATVGGIIFYLTFHVCKDAPFDCILRTPFCAISSLEMMWRPSAEMAVKLTDPNHENRTVLVPATVRGSRRRVLNREPDF